jgi:hypothetical protein
MKAMGVIVFAATAIVLCGCTKSTPPGGAGSGFVTCGAGGNPDFTISLVDGVVKVDPNNGDVLHMPSHGILRWAGPPGFELLFMLQSKEPGSKPGDLPVRKSKPPTDDLCYRIGQKEYTLKYNVYVGTAKLDPTIIVDR